MSHCTKEGAVRGLNLGRKWNESPIRSFYCRMQNRMLKDGCPQAKGSGGCPLRQTCPAHSEFSREVSSPAGVVHSP